MMVPFSSWYGFLNWAFIRWTGYRLARVTHDDGFICFKFVSWPDREWSATRRTS